MAQNARQFSEVGHGILRLALGLAGGALAAFGLSRRNPLALGLTLAGGVLVYRGAAGRWPLGGLIGSSAPETPATFKRAITIGRDPEELYRFWRDFSNLPRFMQHLESVKVLDSRRSHWVAKAPLGTQVEWDAEITADEPGRLISWRALPGAAVYNEGTVRFQPAPGNRGTEIVVEMGYNPPLGIAGRLAAKLAQEEPEQQVSDDLRHLKMMFEAGELATNVMRPQEREVGA